jgi:hypothetical protein
LSLLRVPMCTWAESIFWMSASLGCMRAMDIVSKLGAGGGERVSERKEGGWGREEQEQEGSCCGG